ncbi:hypothetical protein SNE40_013673 [Patella caerulea]|uniref:Uncharacterized protein n=1 Tax=Patella caerulea TaxID=87958 RepID=A0AAN8PP35_PATCE
MNTLFILGVLCLGLVAAYPRSQETELEHVLRGLLAKRQGEPDSPPPSPDNELPPENDEKPDEGRDSEESGEKMGKDFLKMSLGGFFKMVFCHERKPEAPKEEKPLDELKRILNELTGEPADKPKAGPGKLIENMCKSLRQFRGHGEGGDGRPEGGDERPEGGDDRPEGANNLPGPTR